MLIAVIFLTILTQVPYGTTTIIRSCVPNTQFLLNDRLCFCNSLGKSNDSACTTLGPKQTCRPGQIISEECRQCICQENGNLQCTNTDCVDKRIHHRASVRSGSAIWCTPFHSYYFNCTLCVCPASGKMSEARCATDSSCTLKGLHIPLAAILQNICIPKVIYLFNCLHCTCSDDGTFLKSKCVETCHKSLELFNQCTPRSFYKKDCNICFCPDTGLSDTSLCSKSICHDTLTLTSLIALRSKTYSCEPHKFTTPRCFYCECSSQGVVNERACMEQACLKIDDYKYDSVKNNCSLGEMVPTCMECFCPRSKMTEEKYCTSICSYHNKLFILENVMKGKNHLIDRNILKDREGSDICEPSLLFLNQGRYCLCSDSGITSSNYCTSVFDDTPSRKSSEVTVENDVPQPLKIDYNISCEPNTFVKIGCNSCYCTKSGKIDQKWCTNDDCETKKSITHRVLSKVPNKSNTCVPGSISKVDCNYCICRSSGLLADSACTKISCSSLLKKIDDDANCDPTSYYTADCNICLCPPDGIKNVDKCTKNECDANFLRSDICSPGSLFSDYCNICVCPPNGLKNNKICTNRICSEHNISWNTAYKIPQNFLANYAIDNSQNAEPCLPGEKFQVGCKLCVCPDIGLKTYAKCTDVSCNNQTTTLIHIRDEAEEEESDRFKEDREYDNNKLEIKLRYRRMDILPENCMIVNLTESMEREECTPGSEYIIRCRICICPYMGDINHFCRPMPPERYCEEAYPGFNYLPMGRRNRAKDKKASNATVAINNYPTQIHVPHNHTKYKCEVPGRLQDDCYICDCNENVIIQEHCFKSDAKNCTDVTLPSFIDKNKLHRE